MIVTHTQNADGQRRVYIGGKGSLECWIEPQPDGGGWTFHMDEAVTGQSLGPDDKHRWAVHTLLALADGLGVSPDDLAVVPFEAIAALHSSDPFAGRRLPTGKRKVPENAFLAMGPGVTRPRADFAYDAASERFRQR